MKGFRRALLLGLLGVSGCTVLEPRGGLRAAEEAFRQGRYAVARARGETALAAAERGGGTRARGQAENFLAALALLEGRDAEAERRYREALTSFRREAPEDAPAVAAATYNLAGVLSLQGKASEAEPLFKSAVALSSATGVSNEERLERLAGAGLFFEAQRRYDDAEPYYRGAVEAARAAGGDRLKKAEADYRDLLAHKAARKRP